MMDTFYNYQFVDNELHFSDGKDFISKYYIDKLPILEGTMTGTIYSNSNPIQNFLVDTNGKFTFTFTKINNFCYVEDGELDINTGLLRLHWNDIPREHTISVSYECNI